MTTSMVHTFVPDSQSGISCTAAIRGVECSLPKAHWKHASGLWIVQARVQERPGKPAIMKRYGPFSREQATAYVSDHDLRAHIYPLYTPEA